MDNLHKEYIYLDGMWLKEEQLLKLAKNAGCLAMAEHYMCAYLANAVINGKNDAISKLNDVRASYGAAAIPIDNAGLEGSRRDNAAEVARRKFAAMTIGRRRELMKESLMTLKDTRIDLFTTRNHWIAIFLVLRDRLDCSLRKSDFASMVEMTVPRGWPASLTISKATLSNFAHYIDRDDRQEAYYDMENNPWEELCNVFWKITEQLILTSD